MHTARVLTQVAEELHSQRRKDKEEEHEEETQIPHLQRDNGKRGGLARGEKVPGKINPWGRKSTWPKQEFIPGWYKNWGHEKNLQKSIMVPTPKAHPTQRLSNHSSTKEACICFISSEMNERSKRFKGPILEQFLDHYFYPGLWII